MNSLIDITITEEIAHENFNEAFKKIKASTELKRLTGCNVYSKSELTRIMISDCKFDLSDPDTYNKIFQLFYHKSNGFFIRHFKMYDYKISVLPNNNFLIKSI